MRGTYSRALRRVSVRWNYLMVGVFAGFYEQYPKQAHDVRPAGSRTIFHFVILDTSVGNPE